MGPERPRGRPVLGPENAATVRGAAVSPDVPEIGWVFRHLLSTKRRASASRENPKKRKLFFESRRLQRSCLSSSVHQTMHGPRRRLCSLCSISRPLAGQVRRDRPHGRKYGHEQAEQAQKRAAGRDVDRGFPPEAKFRRRSARAVLELLVRA